MSAPTTSKPKFVRTPTKPRLVAARASGDPVAIQAAYDFAVGRGWPARSIAKHLGKRNAAACVAAAEAPVVVAAPAPKAKVVKPVARAAVDFTSILAAQAYTL